MFNQILDIHEEIRFYEKVFFMVDVRFKLTINNTCPADDNAICQGLCPLGYEYR